MCLYSTSDYVKGDNINSFTIVVYGQTYLQLISQLLSFYLNFLILIDLYLSITNPFKNRNKRIKWYFVGAFVMMVLGIVILGCLSRGFRSLQDILSEFFFYQNSDENYGIVIFILTSIVFCTLTLVFGILLCCSLKRKGTSTELKNLVFKRHILYFIGYFVYAAN